MNVKNILKHLLLFVTACMVHSGLKAQLCQGSLGDPIINITFGQGSNPGPALQAATTSYQYGQGECPDDGFYNVRNSSSGCFGSSWHSISSDHTGNGSGYFMLVNASVQPSAFYLDTVRGLCASSTYEFAAWIMNMLLPGSCSNNGIRPDITFRIESTSGALLQSYNTTSIPSTPAPTWKQYGFFFTTPVGTSDIVLRMINNSVGGCGNDLALDDITFRPCGPSLTPVAGLPGNSDAFCQGTAKTYTFSYNVSGGFNAPVFQWQEKTGATWTDIPGATATTLNRNFPATTAPGIYSYRLSVAEAGNMGAPQCRIASIPIVITVHANPVTTAANNGPVCVNSPVILNATGGVTYSWSGVNGFTAAASPATINNVQLSAAGKYYVRVTNMAGCHKTDSTIVVVQPAPSAAVDFSEVTICKEDSVYISGTGGDQYEWQPVTGLASPSAPGTMASPADTTTYSFIATNQFGCKDTAYLSVNIIKKPSADAGPDRYIIAGQPITLEANATGDGISFNWLNAMFIDDPQLLRPTVNPPSNTAYILSVSSVNGCGTATDTMEVKVFEDLYIPNVFTPNGDGKNDTWNIVTLNAFPLHELTVFNRYGQVVFKSRHVNQPWDGKFKGLDLPSGAYVYMIDLKTAERFLLKGTVLIIR